MVKNCELSADLKTKVEFLAATPDELLPGFPPLQRVIIETLKSYLSRS
jgi:hypothetical protein